MADRRRRRRRGLFRLRLFAAPTLALIHGKVCSAFVSTTSPKKTTSERETNVNFEDWIADAPGEVVGWRALEPSGEIPDYVRGTLIRVGGGIWSSANEDGGDDGELFSHIFDGLAKIHAYRIFSSGTGSGGGDDGDDGKSKRVRVEFQTRFLQGSWRKMFQETSRRGKLPIGIGTGPVLGLRDSQERREGPQPKTGLWRTARALWNSATAFDNTPVNIWDFDPQRRRRRRRRRRRGHSDAVVTALTDAPPRTGIGLDTVETLSSSAVNSWPAGAKGYQLTETAHPLYSLTSDDTYNVGVELGWGGSVRVNLIREESGDGSRGVAGSFAVDDGVPYCHSFGLSKNYAVIVLQPLRIDPNPSRLIELGFLRAMKHVDHTRVVVIDLESGKVALDESIDEKVYFYHTISTAEVEKEDGCSAKKGTVSLRLCAYQTPDQLTGEHQFLRLEQARKGEEWRNKLHKGGKFCDLLCDLQEQTVQVKWDDRIEQGFELPITRYSRYHGGGDASDHSSQRQLQQHPRYVYSFGAYALGSPDYDNWALFKFDLEKDEVSAYYQQDSVYLSEPVFVADPKGTKEDDGVLLTQAYFGREEETKLLVLDALTMQVLAEVGTQQRTPMDFHGTWIPAS